MGPFLTQQIHLVAATDNAGSLLFILIHQLLTRDVSVSILQSLEVVHELLHRNPEGLKQTCIFKKPVRNLEDNTKKDI